MPISSGLPLLHLLLLLLLPLLLLALLLCCFFCIRCESKWKKLWNYKIIQNLNWKENTIRLVFISWKWKKSSLFAFWKFIEKLRRRRRREEDGKDCRDDVVVHSPHHHHQEKIILNNLPTMPCLWWWCDNDVTMMWQWWNDDVTMMWRVCDTGGLLRWQCWRGGWWAVGWDQLQQQASWMVIEIILGRVIDGQESGYDVEEIWAGGYLTTDRRWVNKSVEVFG